MPRQRVRDVRRQLGAIVADDGLEGHRDPEVVEQGGEQQLDRWGVGCLQQAELAAELEADAAAGINRGVKGGSYNAKLPDGTPPLDPSEIPYKPEVLLSYEGGFKSTLLDGRATFNGQTYVVQEIV
mgnify:CR=1 FL=1